MSFPAQGVLRVLRAFVVNQSTMPANATLPPVKGTITAMVSFAALRVTFHRPPVFSGRYTLVGYQAGRTARFATSATTSG